VSLKFAGTIPFPVQQYVCNPQMRGTRVRAMESLRDRRERVGLTQAQVAQKCGCHATTISQIESGRMQPSLPLFARLAPVLRVSASKLLDILIPKSTARAVPTASITDLQKERERRQRRKTQH
jgi:transcriptional regulator with XRE-family HTH domain